MDLMDIQEFVFFGTKEQAEHYKKIGETRRPKRNEMKPVRWPPPPRGFKGNTMAKPRPEWMKGSGD
jgi:hypothetical protein